MSENNPEYDNSINHSTNDEGQLVVDLYDANDGRTPRTGGPYLDQIAKEQAEIQRAKLEGREPDLDNPPAVAGTPLVTAAELVDRDVDKSHYSANSEITNEPVASIVVDTTSAFDADPDPTQTDFDNDMTKVSVLEAGTKFKQLKDTTTPAKPETEFEV